MLVRREVTKRLSARTVKTRMARRLGAARAQFSTGASVAGQLLLRSRRLSYSKLRNLSLGGCNSLTSVQATLYKNLPYYLLQPTGDNAQDLVA